MNHPRERVPSSRWQLGHRVIISAIKPLVKVRELA